MIINMCAKLINVKQFGYIIRIGYIPKLLKNFQKRYVTSKIYKKYIPDTCIDMSWKKIQHEDWYLLILN